MALKVRTAAGGTFHRCGMKFGAEPTVVSDKVLAKQFDTPGVTRKSPTIEEILKGESALVCVPHTEKENGDKGKGKGK